MDKETAISSGISMGVSMGIALAMILSYTENANILLAIVHGICSWAYVIYQIIS